MSAWIHSRDRHVCADAHWITGSRTAEQNSTATDLGTGETTEQTSNSAKSSAGKSAEQT